MPQRARRCGSIGRRSRTALDEFESDIAADGEADEEIDFPSVSASKAAAAAMLPERGASSAAKRARVQPAKLRATAPVPTSDSSSRTVDSPRGRLRPRRLSAWSASFVVHGALTALLSLVTITQMAPRDTMDLVVAPAAAEDLDFSTPEADANSAVDANAAAADFTAVAAGNVIDPGTATLGMELGAGAMGDLTSEDALVGGGGGGAASGPFGGRGGAGGLFGDGIGGLAEFGTGLGSAPTAQFFGTKIEGRRIVFVLDNSGSMQGGRLETVIAELLRTVDSLKPDQVFYVVFYSDIAYPLFYPDPATDFIRPTDRNKKLLAEWLDSVELCLGDAVVDALKGALSIEPDAIILLSDGRIQGEAKMQFLLSAGRSGVPLHTVGIGLGAGSTARENLQQIAAANGGDFREAEVPVEMRDLARQKPRPYHNDGPGLVWGRGVKARRGR